MRYHPADERAQPSEFPTIATGQIRIASRFNSINTPTNLTHESCEMWQRSGEPHEANIQSRFGNRTTMFTVVLELLGGTNDPFAHRNRTHHGNLKHQRIGSTWRGVLPQWSAMRPRQFGLYSLP